MIYKGNMQCNINSNMMPTKVKYFKEELITEKMIIPQQKPDVERVLSILVNPQIVSTKLIETQEGYSNEGQKLTGYKLVVELNIEQKITYVANQLRQSVHSAHFNKMKSMFVVLPKEINGKNVCDLVRANRVTVTPYIETARAKILDCRNIYSCSLIFLDVKIC